VAIQWRSKTWQPMVIDLVMKVNRLMTGNKEQPVLISHLINELAFKQDGMELHRI